MKQRYIGIDLGTTNSTISVASLTTNGEVMTQTLEVRQVDETGVSFTYKDILPSVVYIDDNNELYVGEFAKKMIGVFPQNVIRKVKRHIGTDAVWSVNGKKYRAEQISSYVLSALKAQAEEFYNNEEIKGAVITIPANFNFQQENATRLAAELAGFDKDKIYTIPEPTAALIDFLNEERKKARESRRIDLSTPKNLLVFDLGGGTCDVSILRVQELPEGEIDIQEISISQYTELGGIDFDGRVAQYLTNRLLNEKGLTQKSLQEKYDRKVLLKLGESMLDFAEKAKQYFATRIGNTLRNRQMQYIGNEQQFDHLSFRQMLTQLPPELTTTLTITKKEYDQIIEPLLYSGKNQGKNIEDPILNALRTARVGELSKEQIDAVFLVGGMTHYPTIQQRIYEIFDRRLMPIKSVNPMSSVSRGAAVYHYFLDKIHYRSSSEITKESATVAPLPNGLTVKPMVPQNIFINIHGGDPLAILEKGTEAPYSRIFDDVLMVTGPHGASTVHAMKLDLFTAESRKSMFTKKLKSATLQFRKPVAVNSKIVLKVEFTEDRQVNVKAWLKDDETQMIDVNIGSHEFTEQEKAENETMIKNMNKLRGEYHVH
jgi:molecular chaperone DnaK